MSNEPHHTTPRPDSELLQVTRCTTLPEAGLAGILALGGGSATARKDFPRSNASQDQNETSADDESVPVTWENFPTASCYENVSVGGFWSISVYNSEGYFEENEYDAYTANNVIAERDDDGSVTVHFGGDPDQSNFISTPDDWNYMVPSTDLARKSSTGAISSPGPTRSSEITDDGSYYNRKVSSSVKEAPERAN